MYTKIFITGPSGTGKTTLSRIISKRTPNSKQSAGIKVLDDWSYGIWRHDLDKPHWWLYPQILLVQASLWSELSPFIAFGLGSNIREFLTAIKKQGFTIISYKAQSEVQYVSNTRARFNKEGPHRPAMTLPEVKEHLAWYAKEVQNLFDEEWVGEAEDIYLKLIEFLKLKGGYDVS